METYDLVALVIKLVLGGVATFFAILLWSYTRESGWMLVIMAVILSYGSVMYDTLRLFGLLQEGVFLIPGFLHVHVLLENLPTLFLTFALIAHLLGRHRGG